MQKFLIFNHTFLPYFYFKSLRMPFVNKEAIKKIQNKRLRYILRHAYRFVPFYRKLWKKNNIDINSIKTAEDLEKLPIITRQDVTKNFKNLIAVNYKRFLPKIVKLTSGTSSSPITVLFDIKSLNFQQAIFARTLKLLGYKRENPLVIYSHERLKSALDSLGIIKRITINSRLSEEKQLELLRKIDPKYLLYFPQTLFLISKIAKEQGISFNSKIIFTQGEILTKKMRKEILSIFNGKIYDLYASVENGYIAWECIGNEHYHLNEDALLVETIDFHNKLKSIVITNLFNEIMPLIRYEQGDLVKLHNSECEFCNFSSIKSIEGRKRILKFKERFYTERFVINKITSENQIYNFTLDTKRKILQVILKENVDLKVLQKKLKNIVNNVRVVKKISKTRSGKYITFI
jgi:phenylacetate-CoA ligase